MTGGAVAATLEAGAFMHDPEDVDSCDGVDDSYTTSVRVSIVTMRN